MVGYRLWLRHASAVRAFPFFIGLGAVTTVKGTGWRYEWGWGLDASFLGVILLSPLLAGLVAFDRAQRVEPTLARLGGATVRGGRGLLALVLASWSSAVLAWLVMVGYATVVVMHTGARTGAVDWWGLAQVPIVLAASALFGLLVGTVLPNLAGGPVAAVVVYGLYGFWAPDRFGPHPILSMDGTAGTLVGLVRDGALAMSSIGFHLALGALCVAFVVTRGRPWLLRAGVVGAGLAVFVLAGVHAGALTRDREVLVASSEPQVCVGSDVQVCGPRSGRWLWQVGQVGLHQAIDRLAGSGIDWQRHYVWTDGSGLVPADSGMVTVQPENLVDERMGFDDVRMSLLTPRSCAIAYDIPESGDLPAGLKQLMATQTRVWDWLTAALASPVPPGPAPVAVRTAYQQLRTCEPLTAPVGHSR